MNIFVTDLDPYKAAQSLCDKHVVKMILESCQLLCTWLSTKHSDTYKLHSNFLYKPTHINHPCSVWLRESDSNVWRLISHTKELIHEYYKRYGKVHACYKVWKLLIGLVAELVSPEDTLMSKLTSFKQCMPEQYKVEGNPIEAYRSYMVSEKTRFAKWKLGNKPEWWL